MSVDYIIPSFPIIHPGELLHGVFARHYARLRPAGHEMYMREVFGARGGTATRDLTRRLAYLVEHLLDHGDTVDDLIEGHTAFRYYAPFLSPDGREQLCSGMQGSTKSGHRIRAGIMQSSVPARPELRYCPACAAQDRKDYGYALWHVLHQLPGVEACPTHSVWLELGAAAPDDSALMRTFILADQAIPRGRGRKIAKDDPDRDTLLALAQDAAWLLAQEHLAPGPGEVRRRYTLLLEGHGLITAKGLIRMRALRQRIEDRYGQLLIRLGCPLGVGAGADWLARLVRQRSEQQHPLYHLLLIQALDQSAESFFALAPEHRYEPFGQGPWPCLNPAAAHYRQPVATLVRISRGSWSGAPVGLFTCACGFTYSRKGPDSVPEDRYRITQVRARGAVWEAALRTLWADPACTLVQIADQLGASYYALRDEARTLELPWPPAGSPRAQADSARHRARRGGARRTGDLRDHHRGLWRDAVTQAGDGGMTDARALAGASHEWLRVYDKPWFDANKPAPRARKPKQSRVDWARRDKDGVRALQKQAAKIRGLPGRPVRVTRNALVIRIRRRGMQLSLDRQPGIRAALLQLEEPREAFALRRIAWLVEHHLREGTCPTRSQIANLALGREMAKQPAVHAAIEAAWYTLASGVGSVEDERPRRMG